MDLRGVVVLLVTYVMGVTGGPGTTPNIQEIFIGRCWEYQEIASQRLVKPETLDCDELWDTFMTGFAFKDPKDIRRADYQPFFDEAKQTIPENTTGIFRYLVYGDLGAGNHVPTYGRLEKYIRSRDYKAIWHVGDFAYDLNSGNGQTLLWSGTFDLAHKYGAAGSRYLTMEDSLIGYLANGLRWCGRVCQSCDGINYEACPNFDELPLEASQAFWGGASTTFASSARKTVKLMLSGSNPKRKAYLRSSFFAQFELKSLQKDKMHLVIVLANEIGKPALEHCGTDSLVLLQEDLEIQGINYSCVENPPDVLHLMCVDHTDDEACKLFAADWLIDNRSVLSNILLGKRDTIG